VVYRIFDTRLPEMEERRLLADRGRRLHRMVTRPPKKLSAQFVDQLLEPVPVSSGPVPSMVRPSVADFGGSGPQRAAHAQALLLPPDNSGLPGSAGGPLPRSHSAARRQSTFHVSSIATYAGQAVDFGPVATLS